MNEDPRQEKTIICPITDDADDYARWIAKEQKIQLIRECCDRLAQHTYSYLTSIVLPLPGKRGQHIGSGLRCMLRGQKCILTADHVIREEFLDKQRDFAVSVGYGQEGIPFHGNIKLEPHPDLAICLLPESHPGPSATIKFWDLDRSLREDRSRGSGYFFTHGYPGTMSQYEEALAALHNRSLAYGAVERKENLPGQHYAFHFLMDYRKERMRGLIGDVTNVLDPHGMSGSAVWELNLEEGKEGSWCPDDIRLIGVLVQYHATHDCLRCTELGEVRKLADRPLNAAAVKLELPDVID